MSLVWEDSELRTLPKFWGSDRHLSAGQWIAEEDVELKMLNDGGDSEPLLRRRYKLGFSVVVKTALTNREQDVIRMKEHQDQDKPEPKAGLTVLQP